jgi:Flp pilus assembly pilin Flp
MWKLLKCETGASAVEYCILVAFIAVVIFAAVGALGTSLSGRYSAMATALGS